MKFIDEITIRVIAGKGGKGAASFRREKFIPKGGPDGGDGGKGGSVILEASKDVQTLHDFRYQSEYRAKGGEHGRGAQCYGKAAEDIILKVPVGTIVKSEDGEISEDLCHDGQQIVVAKGGKGGLGNLHFKSSTNRAPRQFTPGDPGEERDLHLELKLLSHVGLVGFPNAGKSSFLNAISNAHPKVADYPFTTLTPHLGVVEGLEPPLVIADIPGIIEGAHEGAGLGLQFLKHISRSYALMFMLSFDPTRSLDRTLGLLLEEIKSYDSELLNRPRLYVVNKADLIEGDSEDEQIQLWKAEWEAFKAKHPETHLISATNKLGLQETLASLHNLVFSPLERSNPEAA
jgi:GTP-binding protein